jgi:hypothetical protein
MDIALSLDLLRNYTQEHNKCNVWKSSNAFFKLHLTDITEKIRKYIDIRSFVLESSVQTF